MSELVDYVTSMVDQFCEDHIVSAVQASAEEEVAGASHPGPAAPAQSPEPVACNEAAAAVAEACQPPLDPCFTAADSVAWHAAVVAGALALSRLLQDARGRCDDVASSPAAAAELVSVSPVQAALLFAAVEGLYFRVRQDLLLNLADGRAGCDCAVCMPQVPPENPSKTAAACKADIASKVREPKKQGMSYESFLLPASCAAAWDVWGAFACTPVLAVPDSTTVTDSIGYVQKLLGLLCQSMLCAGKAYRRFSLQTAQ
jgi:hypothetical protein